jgi:hypothetical protein
MYVSLLRVVNISVLNLIYQMNFISIILLFFFVNLQHYQDFIFDVDNYIYCFGYFGADCL